MPKSNAEKNSEQFQYDGTNLPPSHDAKDFHYSSTYGLLTCEAVKFEQDIENSPASSNSLCLLLYFPCTPPHVAHEFQSPQPSFYFCLLSVSFFLLTLVGFHRWRINIEIKKKYCYPRGGRGGGRKTTVGGDGGGDAAGHNP
jgi:hypothetical protein